MKKSLYILSVILSSLLFTGCVKAHRPAEQRPDSTPDLPARETVSVNVKEYNKGVANIRLHDGVSPEMTSPYFWIANNPDAERVILDAEGIQAFNSANVQEITTESGNKVSVLGIAETLSGSFVKELINCAYDFGTVPVYKDGVQTGSSYWNAMKNSLNTANVPDTVAVKYGYSVNYTTMRSYPSWDYFYEKSNPDFDKNLRTDLLPYQPVAVLHESIDGQWLYILFGTCGGWVEKENVAYCQTRADWEQRMTPDDFLVVTAKEIRTDTDINCPAVSDKFLPMGTVLPLANGVKTVRGRTAYGCYTVKVPARDKNGMIYDEYMFLPYSRDVSCGYLPMTYENAMLQAFKYHGSIYGMGGAFNSVDCSGYVRNIFLCFGIELPRAAVLQSRLNSVDITDMGSMNSRQKARQLAQQGGITLIYMKGHIMLYLGTVNGEPYAISSIYGVGSKTTGVELVASVAISDMDKSYKSDGISLLNHSLKLINFK